MRRRLVIPQAELPEHGEIVEPTSFGIKVDSRQEKVMQMLYTIPLNKAMYISYGMVSKPIIIKAVTAFNREQNTYSASRKQVFDDANNCVGVYITVRGNQ